MGGEAGEPSLHLLLSRTRPAPPCPHLRPLPPRRVSTALIMLATAPPAPVSTPAMAVPVIIMISREIAMSALREWAAASGGGAHKVRAGGKRFMRRRRGRGGVGPRRRCAASGASGGWREARPDPALHPRRTLGTWGGWACSWGQRQDSIGWVEG